jgi:two-component system chemotaxis response regulator CheB
MPTSLSCPECFGVLTGRTDGPNALLTYVCRVGHTFAIPELLLAKEELLERWLWASLLSLEELAAFLSELADLAAPQAATGMAATFRERAERARGEAASIRAVIERNRAVEVPQESSRISGNPATP